MRVALSMPHDRVARGVEDEERASEVRDGGSELFGRDLLHEAAADGDGASAQVDGRGAVRADGVERAREVVGDAAGVEGGADGGHGLGRRDAGGGLEDGRAAQRVADEEPGGEAARGERVGRRHEVVHVRGEGGVREFAL